MSGKYSQTAGIAQREASMEVLNHITVCRLSTLTANTTIQASSKHSLKKKKKTGKSSNEFTQSHNYSFIVVTLECSLGKSNLQL